MFTSEESATCEICPEIEDTRAFFALKYEMEAEVPIPAMIRQRTGTRNRVLRVRLENMSSLLVGFCDDLRT
jgi:hypothetical protein